jgi:hypothetical protein
MARATSYTDELGKAICDRIAEGETLISVTKDEGMPSLATVSRWLNDSKQADTEFFKLYTTAREVQYIIREEEILEISDDGRRDYLETDDGVVVDHDHINRAKLRVDSRKWLLSKLLPLRFGDRIAHQALDEHGKPARMEITVTRVSAPDPQRGDT